MRPIQNTFGLIFLIVVLSSGAHSAFSQNETLTPPPPVAPKEVTKEKPKSPFTPPSEVTDDQAVTEQTLEKKIQQIDAEETLEATLKEQLIQTYRSALDAIRRRNSFRTKMGLHKEAVKGLEKRIEGIRKELTDLPEKMPVSVTSQSELSDIETAVKSAEAELRELETQRSAAEKAVLQLTLERKQALELQVTNPNRVKDTQQKLATPPPDDQPPALTAAFELLYTLQLEALEIEADAVREEIARYDAEKNVRLLDTEFELLTKKVNLQRERVERLQQLASEKKIKNNMQALKDLKEESLTSLPVLKSYVDEIEYFTRRETELVALTNEIQDRQKTVRELLESVETDQLDTIEKDRIDIGSSQAFALSLLGQLYELPDISVHQREVQARKQKMSEATFQQIELRSQSRKLIDVDKAAESAYDQLKSSLADQKAASPELSIFEESIPDKLKELLVRKRSAMEELASAYGDLLDALTQLDATQRSLVKTTSEYQDFIRRRIFWIRSDEMIGVGQLMQLAHRRLIPFSKDDIFDAVGMLGKDAYQKPLLYGLAISIFALLILMRVQAGREITALAEEARKANAYKILPTFRAMLLTAVLAAPLPLMIWFLGWRFSQPTMSDPFRIALGETLRLMGMICGGYEFLRQICRRHGLADAHFEGPNLLSTRSRHDYLLAGIVLLPLFTLITLLNRLTSDVDRTVWERVLFAISMLLAAAFIHRLINPNRPLMREVFRMKNASPISNSRWIWYPVSTLFPIVMFAMAWVGYYYTASQLAWRFMLTLFMLCGILIWWGIEMRWYRMAQRWYNIFVLRERRRQEAEESLTLEGQRIKLENEAEAADFDREKQTLRLINFITLVPFFIGFGVIWIDVLPAVAYLGEIELWSTTVEKIVEGADGTQSLQTVREPITPVDFICAGIGIIVTIGLTRNLPGMIDFAVLQRVNFDASLRYALTTVIGYLVTFVGATYALSTIGFRWEQIQWLATALTFGLSFGLQEIFANFVSGLIILFERPIRIGDIVTIEGVTGVVSRVRIRASTITDWDRKEYLVPNKEIVTGRLLNWTLSDTMNRITVPVGVAYGTDAEKVRQLLFDIAEKDSSVLRDPTPLVTFESFGDSTLNFVLRVYLEKMDDRLETIHRLHSTINRRFMEDGIEIAFPQRDLHIRSVPPSWGANPTSSPTSD